MTAYDHPAALLGDRLTLQETGVIADPSAHTPFPPPALDMHSKTSARPRKRRAIVGEARPTQWQSEQVQRAMKRLGQFLGAERELKGLSQRKAARLAGLSQPVGARIERGESVRVDFISVMSQSISLGVRPEMVSKTLRSSRVEGLKFPVTEPMMPMPRTGLFAPRIGEAETLGGWEVIETKPAVKELGRRLGAARVAMGISQRELGRRARVSYAMISKLEDGEIQRPEFIPLVSIGEQLGLSIADLTQILIRGARS